MLKGLFNFVMSAPKRKQALPEGNLPAIRLMATIVEAAWGKILQAVSGQSEPFMAKKTHRL